MPFLAELLERQWAQIGGYPEHIKTWEKHFSNISFIYHDDLHTADGTGLKQICESLGVSWGIGHFVERDVKVNSQGTDAFPPALRMWVASKRMDELNWVADRFGERAEQWRDEAFALSQS